MRAVFFACTVAATLVAAASAAHVDPCTRIGSNVVPWGRMLSCLQTPAHHPIVNADIRAALEAEHHVVPSVEALLSNGAAPAPSELDFYVALERAALQAGDTAFHLHLPSGYSNVRAGIPLGIDADPAKPGTFRLTAADTELLVRYQKEFMWGSDMPSEHIGSFIVELNGNRDVRAELLRVAAKSAPHGASESALLSRVVRNGAYWDHSGADVATLVAAIEEPEVVEVHVVPTLRTPHAEATVLRMPKVAFFVDVETGGPLSISSAAQLERMALSPDLSAFVSSYAQLSESDSNVMARARADVVAQRSRAAAFPSVTRASEKISSFGDAASVRMMGRGLQRDCTSADATVIGRLLGDGGVAVEYSAVEGTDAARVVRIGAGAQPAEAALFSRAVLRNACMSVSWLMIDLSGETTGQQHAAAAMLDSMVRTAQHAVCRPDFRLAVVADATTRLDDAIAQHIDGTGQEVALVLLGGENGGDHSVHVTRKSSHLRNLVSSGRIRAGKSPHGAGSTINAHCTASGVADAAVALTVRRCVPQMRLGRAQRSLSGRGEPSGDAVVRALAASMGVVGTDFSFADLHSAHPMPDSVFVGARGLSVPLAQAADQSGDRRLKKMLRQMRCEGETDYFGNLDCFVDICGNEAGSDSCCTEFPAEDCVGDDGAFDEFFPAVSTVPTYVPEGVVLRGVQVRDLGVTHGDVGNLRIELARRQPFAPADFVGDWSRRLPGMDIEFQSNGTFVAVVPEVSGTSLVGTWSFDVDGPTFVNNGDPMDPALGGRGPHVDECLTLEFEPYDQDIFARQEDGPFRPRDADPLACPPRRVVKLDAAFTGDCNAVRMKCKEEHLVYDCAEGTDREGKITIDGDFSDWDAATDVAEMIPLSSFQGGQYKLKRARAKMEGRHLFLMTELEEALTITDGLESLTTPDPLFAENRVWSFGINIQNSTVYSADMRGFSNARPLLEFRTIFDAMNVVPWTDYNVTLSPPGASTRHEFCVDIGELIDGPSRVQVNSNAGQQQFSTVFFNVTGEGRDIVYSDPRRPQGTALRVVQYNLDGASADALAPEMARYLSAADGDVLVLQDNGGSTAPADVAAGLSAAMGGTWSAHSHEAGLAIAARSPLTVVPVPTPTPEIFVAAEVAPEADPAARTLVISTEMPHFQFAGSHRDFERIQRAIEVAAWLEEWQEANPDVPVLLAGSYLGLGSQKPLDVLRDVDGLIEWHTLDLSAGTDVTWRDIRNENLIGSRPVFNQGAFVPTKRDWVLHSANVVRRAGYVLDTDKVSADVLAVLPVGPLGAVQPNDARNGSHLAVVLDIGGVAAPVGDYLCRSAFEPRVRYPMRQCTNEYEAVTLYDRLCGGSQDLSLSFADSAPITLHGANDVDCASSPVGSCLAYRPYSPFDVLSSFGGAGVQGLNMWDLVVVDEAAGDDGVLEGWTLDLCFEQDTCVLPGGSDVALHPPQVSRDSHCPSTSSMPNSRGTDCPVGCDGRLLSGLEEDGCGICGGDGSTCIGCDPEIEGSVRNNCNQCGDSMQVDAYPPGFTRNVLEWQWYRLREDGLSTGFVAGHSYYRDAKVCRPIFQSQYAYSELDRIEGIMASFAVADPGSVENTTVSFEIYADGGFDADKGQHMPDFSAGLLQSTSELISDIERDVIDQRDTYAFFSEGVARPSGLYWACLGLDYPVGYDPRNSTDVSRVALYTSRAGGLDSSAAIIGVSATLRGRFDGYDDFLQYTLDDEPTQDLETIVPYNFNSTDVGGIDLHLFPIVSECDPCNEDLSENAPGLGRLTHNLCGHCPHVDDTTPGDCICEYYIQPVHVCDERLDDGTCLSTYAYISDFGPDGPEAIGVPSGTEQNSVCGREPLVGCGFAEAIVIEDDLSQSTIDVFQNTQGDLSEDTFTVHWRCGDSSEVLEWRVADVYSQHIAQTNGVPSGGLCSEGTC